MRTLRASLASMGLLGLACGIAQAQQTPADLLTKFQPTQAGVEMETPTDPKVVAACRLETVKNPTNNKVIGYALRDGQGKLLRKFVDTDGNSKLDQWSYFLDGFEVYREVDVNGDQSLDECQWLNSGGTRIATISRGKITGWKRLSAEEASKVLVQSLVTGDAALFQSIFAAPDELTALGVPAAEIERATAESAQRQAQMAALTGKLVGWNKQTGWLRFDGMMPRSIPKDIATGLKSDILLYENAVVFATPGDAKGDPSKLAYLQLPELVRIGDTWKLSDTPRVIDPAQNRVEMASRQVGIRAALYAQMSGDSSGDPKFDAALKALAEFDTANASKLAAMDRKALTAYYANRVKLLRDVVRLASADNDKAMYSKQMVDSLAASIQSSGDAKNEANVELAKVAKDGGKLGSYAAYRSVMVQYALQSEEPGANLLQVQKNLLAGLEGFIKTYATSEEAPEALLQLAHLHEFNAEEESATKYYKELTEKFAASEQAQKAAGALRRMNLVGKAMELKGTDIKGQAVDIAAYKGKTTLVLYWATWAEQSRKDLPELKKLYQKYKEKGLEIVSVNLDTDKAQLDAQLQSEPLPWTVIYDAGGYDSKMAVQYGIISLPTLVLIDKDGKVVSRNLRLANEVEKALEKNLAGSPDGVALGTK